MCSVDIDCWPLCYLTAVLVLYLLNILCEACCILLQERVSNASIATNICSLKLKTEQNSREQMNAS